MTKLKNMLLADLKQLLVASADFFFVTARGFEIFMAAPLQRLFRTVLILDVSSELDNAFELLVAVVTVWRFVAIGLKQSVGWMEAGRLVNFAALADQVTRAFAQNWTIGAAAASLARLARTCRFHALTRETLGLKRCALAKFLWIVVNFAQALATCCFWGRHCSCKKIIHWEFRNRKCHKKVKGCLKSNSILYSSVLFPIGTETFKETKHRLRRLAVRSDRNIDASRRV